MGYLPRRLKRPNPKSQPELPLENNLLTKNCAKCLPIPSPNLSKHQFLLVPTNYTQSRTPLCEPMFANETKSERKKNTKEKPKKTSGTSLRIIHVVCAVSVGKPAWNNSARLALRVGERRLRDLYRHAAQKASARSNLRVWENVCAIIFKPLRHTGLRDQFGVCAGGLHDRL